MDDYPIDSTQRAYSRLAGFSYLFNYATAVLGVIMISTITGSGTFTEKAARVVASKHLYEFALMSLVVSWVTIVTLAYGLYISVKPVNKRLAQIALFMELCEASVGATIVMWSYAKLQLYTLGQAAGPAEKEVLSAVVSATRAAGDSGFQIAMTFFAVGSMIFFYLFYKSRYIPRPIAGIGVFGSVVMLIVSLAALSLPEYAAKLQWGWGPMGIAEITTGFWLLIVGVRSPAAKGREMAAA